MRTTLHGAQEDDKPIVIETTMASIISESLLLGPPKVSSWDPPDGPHGTLQGDPLGVHVGVENGLEMDSESACRQDLLNLGILGVNGMPK